MASSAHNHHGGATSAPPPTPSTQSDSLLSSDAADSLSRLLIRHLPPALSLPTARRATATASATCPPLVSLSDGDSTALLTASSQLGFFQLTDHSVPSQLAHSAESEALYFFKLCQEDKDTCHQKSWPLGYDEDRESFCLDSSLSDEISLPCVGELTRELERVGLRVVELLAESVGFESPEKLCTLTWLSEGKDSGSGGFYPYVVGLQYETRVRRYSLLGDSGWVTVSPRVDSVMVTVGDIAQVMSNGKLKKVRGRPVGISSEATSDDNNLSISVLITLPLESTVSPLNITLNPLISYNHGPENCLEAVNEEEELTSDGEDGERRENIMFNSFSFEDYAWRVYHERLPLKDPLHKYRIKN